MISQTNFSRRDLLRTVLAGGAAAAFPYVVRAAALGKDGAVAASERITVGCVGVGPQGTFVMRNFLAQKDAQVLAVCDVKRHVLQAAQKRVNDHYGRSDCAAYRDFRELTAREDIDVVLAAPPDHWHVLIALAAVRSGKDVYLEKPMGLSLQEDQILRAEVRRYGRVFQFGTQQRSSRNFRYACELVRNGRIGKLQTIHVWSPGSSAGGSPKPAAVPDWLDYDMWLGPAPYHPYTPQRCSHNLWWFISDYALGFIAGWGIHPMDIALWGGGEKLSGLVEVEGKGIWPEKGVCDTALNWDVRLKFASGVVIHFTGWPCPQQWRKRYGRTTSHGTAFEGTDGWVHVDRARINASSKALLETEFGPGDVRLYQSNHHVRNFLDCVKTRAKTICPVEEAVAADIMCHISDIAIRLERKLLWDPQKERFVNDETANRRLRRAMRSPWRL